MPKKKLTLDALVVESFEIVAGEANPHGTVQAHEATGFTSYCQCQNATHYGTCQETCVNTCGGPGCETFETFYLTCQAGCSWTDGENVCFEPKTTEC